MKKVLVFGGSRFFGKKAVELLIQQGYEVTLANRGISETNFGTAVKQIRVDRKDAAHQGWQAIVAEKWDIVLDNICYNKEEAQIAIDYLAGKVEYYLFTSSLSIYPMEVEAGIEGFKETDFEPASYQINQELEVDYSEGKRQAEATFAKAEAFPLAILRIPMVLDDDDYTERLYSYIQQVRQEETIVFYDLTAQMGFIKGSEVAKIMLWLIKNQITGIINASSNGIVSMNQLMNWIEEVVKIEPLVLESAEDYQQTPFSTPTDWYLDCSKITQLGYSLPDLKNWLMPLIRRLNEQITLEKIEER